MRNVTSVMPLNYHYIDQAFNFAVGPIGRESCTPVKSQMRLMNVKWLVSVMTRRLSPRVFIPLSLEPIGHEIIKNSISWVKLSKVFVSACLFLYYEPY